VIGGLVSSTILTLLVLPVLYYLVEGAQERRAEYPPLRPSALTRTLAIVGGVVLAGGIGLRVYGFLATLSQNDLLMKAGIVAAGAGLALMIAALVIWLVRSFRNRRAHPLVDARVEAPAVRLG
jgi:uncharacterized protein (DUF2062 family)